jgi:hypothetical protein
MYSTSTKILSAVYGPPGQDEKVALKASQEEKLKAFHAHWRGLACKALEEGDGRINAGAVTIAAELVYTPEWTPEYVKAIVARLGARVRS